MSGARQRWYVVAVLGGLLAVIAAGVVALSWGRSSPSPPYLPDAPEPTIPGQILYLDRDSCLVVVRASGEEPARQTYCLGTWPRVVAFVDADTIVYLDDRTLPPELVTVDLTTRKVVSRAPAPGVTAPAPQVAPDGTELTVREDGRVQLLRGGALLSTIEFPGVDWAPQPLGWSPDSQWIAFGYYPPRSSRMELWIVSRDGSVRGTLARGLQAGPLAWYIEGTGSWPQLPR